MPPTPQEFIARYVEEVEPLERRIALAQWDASLSGRSEDFDLLARLHKEWVELHGRRDAFDAVSALRESLVERSGGARDDSGEESLVARQIDLVWRAYRSSQGDKELVKRIVDLQTELDREYNTFRAEYRGEKRTNNDLEEILRTTRDDAEAREAWEALKQVGAMAAPRVVELARLRNRHAQELGSRNFYEFSLELGELELGDLFRLLNDIERDTRPLFRDLKDELDARLARAFSIGTGDLRPWHYRNPFFQDMPRGEEVDLDPVFADADIEALTRAYYDGIGLDIRGILAASDLYEKEGKDQHAFCIGIDLPSDVRVLCNIRPSSRWMSTMLHEFGHAVYDKCVDPALPYVLRGPAHTMTTEAVAMLNERAMSSAEFLNAIVGVERSKAEAMAAALRRHQRRKLIVFARWVLVMTHFERAMYEDPERDLDPLWWETVERFQWLDGSERRACPDWAAKMHLAGAPVYYQNYLLGEMTASQILAAIRRETKKEREDMGETPMPLVANPKAGEFLRERLFRPGSSKPWNARLAEATGEELNPRFFLEDLRERQRRAR
ncbi:M2 family metallopeptidase [Candidatus Sumerlaeota bacterium]|nr:M2 family metallopeptidase [Candidatus Sumerlaeota bacterium]